VLLRCSRPLAGALTTASAGYLVDIAVIASLQRRSEFLRYRTPRR